MLAPRLSYQGIKLAILVVRVEYINLIFNRGPSWHIYRHNASLYSDFPTSSTEYFSWDYCTLSQTFKFSKSPRKYPILHTLFGRRMFTTYGRVAIITNCLSVNHTTTSIRSSLCLYSTLTTKTLVYHFISYTSILTLQDHCHF